MIIISQDEKGIINFDNVMNIEITDCDEDGFGLFAGMVIGIDDNYKLLGYYKNEKRAKEVLQDIVDINSAHFIEITCYQMPKE